MSHAELDFDPYDLNDRDALGPDHQRPAQSFVHYQVFTSCSIVHTAIILTPISSLVRCEMSTKDSSFT